MFVCPSASTVEDRLVRLIQRVKTVSERVFALADGPKYDPIKPVSVCTEVSSSVVVWPWTPQDQRLALKKISVRHDQKCDNEMAIIEFCQTRYLSTGIRPIRMAVYPRGGLEFKKGLTRIRDCNYRAISSLAWSGKTVLL